MMKTEKNIFVAFLLNLGFSVLEFVGGVITGSVAIVSDAVHDLGDAASIGVSYLLERKSRKQPDDAYTYGYGRYSVVGGMITNLILLIGSVMVVCHAVCRLINPVEIRYHGMIVFAVIGVLVNFVAAYLTREGDSVNQKAVNLHMLEDVLGWAVVLAGAVVMRFTDWVWIDSVMSIGVAIFILAHALRNFKEVMEMFLEKTPRGISIPELKEHLAHIEGVRGIHHIHLWSMDGRNNVATLHVVAEGAGHEIKEKVREELKEHGIGHATIELEAEDEDCPMEHCHMETASSGGHHHHH